MVGFCLQIVYSFVPKSQSESKYQFLLPAAQDVCPPLEYRPERCRTCCCKTSDNADFFHPEVASQPKCTATDVANYKVSLIPSISPVCHEDYPFVGGVDNAYFSDLLITTHPGVQIYDSCGDNIFPNPARYIEMTEEILPIVRGALEQEVADGILHDYYLGSRVLEPAKRKRRSARVGVSPSMPFMTLISKLVNTEVVCLEISILLLLCVCVCVCVCLNTATNRTRELVGGVQWTQPLWTRWMEGDGAGVPETVCSQLHC